MSQWCRLGGGAQGAQAPLPPPPLCSGYFILYSYQTLTHFAASQTNNDCLQCLSKKRSLNHSSEFKQIQLPYVLYTMLCKKKKKNQQEVLFCKLKILRDSVFSGTGHVALPHLPPMASQLAMGSYAVGQLHHNSVIIVTIKNLPNKNPGYIRQCV